MNTLVDILTTVSNMLKRQKNPRPLKSQALCHLLTFRHNMTTHLSCQNTLWKQNRRSAIRDLFFLFGGPAQFQRAYWYKEQGRGTGTRQNNLIWYWFFFPDFLSLQTSQGHGKIFLVLNWRFWYNVRRLPQKYNLVQKN